MARTKKEETINNDITIDKKQLIKEIKSEAKEELLEELRVQIEIKTKDKLDKMEKRIYKQKNSTIMKKNIIILLLILIIALESKLLYDSNYFSGVVGNSTNILDKIPVSSNDTLVKDEAWYLENYSYLLDNIKTNLSNSEIDYLYRENYTETNIANNVKLNMAYQLLNNDDISNDDSVITIKEDKIKESYKKIFGNLDNYQADNFTNNCIQFIYNKNSSKYMAINMECPSTNEVILESITRIYEENTNIIIETIVGRFDNSTGVLKNINQDIIAEGFNNSTSLTNYQDSLNKYRYTFYLLADNYYLKSIERIV